MFFVVCFCHDEHYRRIIRWWWWWWWWWWWRWGWWWWWRWRWRRQWSIPGSLNDHFKTGVVNDHLLMKRWLSLWTRGGLGWERLFEHCSNMFFSNQTSPKRQIKKWMLACKKVDVAGIKVHVACIKVDVSWCFENPQFSNNGAHYLFEHALISTWFANIRTLYQNSLNGHVFLKRSHLTQTWHSITLKWMFQVPGCWY